MKNFIGLGAAAIFWILRNVANEVSPIHMGWEAYTFFIVAILWFYSNPNNIYASIYKIIKRWFK